MLNKLRRILTASSVAMAIWATPLFAETQLRMTWYNDGIEGEVMRSLLDRFEAQNSDIKVTLDVVPYKSIMESLPVQLAAGDGPDIARVTDLGGLSKYYMNLRPHLSDADYWEKSFGPFLKLSLIHI